jgi:PHD/YefM family antitoxin component YafN of YafNO toxin-antitoxin module
MKSKTLFKQKLKEYLETLGILSNPETMKSIKRSREDIKKGRVRKVANVSEMLDDS